MERRDFLKNSTVAAAGMMMIPSLDMPGKSKPYVIIIGAGLAGLAAAYRLKKNNVPYILLEARNRVGGRIYTYTADESEKLTCELGAEWIGNSHKEIMALCDEFKLETLNHQFDTRLMLNEQYFQPGQWNYEEGFANYQEAVKNFATLPEKEAKKLDKLDWWRYLNNLGLSERDIEIKELLDSTDFGETIRNVSAYAAISEYAFSSEKNEMDKWIKGGNSKLIEALQNYVGNDMIKTGHAVDKVSYSGKKIVVTCKNGFSVQGDRLICTAPTFAVNKIQWEPALPADKTEALNELQYCRIMKASVLFTSRFWQDEAFDMITDTPAQYFFHSTKLQEGTKGILTSYTIGDKAYALSKMNQKQKVMAICNSLRPAFGDITRYADKIFTYYWGGDVHTQGAYAIYDTRQWFNLRPLLKEPVKNIHFAGEHLAEWQGFMEGAIVTGYEAAARCMG